MNLAPVEFVNIHGQYVDTNKRVKIKRETKLSEPSHNGWRVIGIPGGALEEAEKAHPKLIADAIGFNEARKIGERAMPVPGPWDADKWLRAQKGKPIRSRPFSISEAAQEMKALSEKAGWLRVEIVELKKE